MSLACVEGRMNVHFRVQYWTRWGQNLVLCGSTPRLGSWDCTRGARMTCYHDQDRLIWEVILPMAVPPPKLKEGEKDNLIEYSYCVVDEEGVVEKKETVVRRLTLSEGCGKTAEVFDTWQDRSSPYVVVASKAFREAIGLRRTPAPNPDMLRYSAREGHVIFRFIVRDWLCEDGQSLHVIGGIPQLGNFQQDHALRLTEMDFPAWEGEILVPEGAFPFTYKFAVMDDKGVMSEEEGERKASIRENSGIGAISKNTPSLAVVDGGHFRHPRQWRGAGIAVPVFSLRTDASVGVGEFTDLKLLIDFCERVGFQMIQVLPINDTTVTQTALDSYPYSSLSVFALHPLYLCLDKMIEDMPEEIAAKIEDARKNLDSEVVEYEATLKQKRIIAQKIFLLNGKATIKKNPEFMEFFKKNQSWLVPYAAFLVIRRIFKNSAKHWRWGDLGKPTQEQIEWILDPCHDFHETSVLFEYYLQFHLHKQLVEVRKYAESKGVALKGDLPIGVDKCSVDTWMAPSLFRMDKSTGAPPDYFDPRGQNWGFPTYNWEEMAKDDYAWWKQRLSILSQYFHAYRIDHVLGFFRIWEIPDHCQYALLGCFRPSYPLTRQELESRGIWDFDRLCEPFVQWSHLEEMFGDWAHSVAADYFHKQSNGLFRFREECNSEVKIKKICSKKRGGEGEETGLLKLLQNVLLIRHPKDNDAFFPRFDLRSTSSFADLNGDWQDTLIQLHDDYYYHRHNELWRDHALKTLPVLINSTDMLVCGEDLGMIPSCVHPVMEELGLLGMRIQRMPSEPDQKFGDPSTYPYLTVCSPSCHDVLTSRGWWEEDEERREEFYREVLGGKEEKAPQECTPEIMKAITQQHMDAPSALTIIPLQDIFALSSKYNTRPAKEETINDPRNPTHYWGYRMHVTMETLLEDRELQTEVIGLMEKSWRGPKFWRGPMKPNNRTRTNNITNHNSAKTAKKKAADGIEK
ncbi:hypothetical protein BSKO_04161 [Bryopsis sp. KO-2023]|nr:hypothetical protein BSKO_04161 [Bryopsis sp. KO-2023]